MKSLEFYRPVRHCDIRKIEPKLEVKRERAIRLYCDQFATTWQLQIRSAMTLRSGGESKDFLYAAAFLSREDMELLRSAIDAELDRAGPAVKK